MKIIKPRKEIDCLTALEVFKQVPIDTTGHVWSKDGILWARFYLQANPKDERFDSRYTLAIKPWSPYFFQLRDGSKDLRVEIENLQPGPGNFAASLLVSGKRPGGLYLSFNNHLDERKAWSYFVREYISSLIESGYNHIPHQNHTIAEISASKDEVLAEDSSVKTPMDSAEILTIKPNEVKLRLEELFGSPLITREIYDSIARLVS